MPLYPSTSLYPSATLFPALGAIIPPPALVASSRYMNLGVTRVYFIPTIAATTLVPTRAEMNAGTDLTGEIADWTGWIIDAELLDVQSMNSLFKATVPGNLSSPSSSLTLYASKTGADVRTVLVRGTSGFIEILDGGDVLANRAEVYPVTVASVSLVRGVIGGSSSGSSTDAASQVRVMFAITAAPAQNVTVPA